MISEQDLAVLAKALNPLVGVQLQILRLPIVILKSFEPSQIGTICGTLMDACIPELPVILKDEAALDLSTVGLTKHEGILKDREGYPDYKHTSGKRLELKLIYVDPVDVEMKKPATPREPSARLTQKVTVKNVEPEDDALMVVAYQLQPTPGDADLFSPSIIDIGLFPMIECVLARDHRLSSCGGRWFGDYETPCVPSRIGQAKIQNGMDLDGSSYGRKESEGRDFNEDTNFGKLKRIPYKPLQLFLQKHGAVYMASGEYPQPWSIGSGLATFQFEDAVVETEE